MERDAEFRGSPHDEPTAPATEYTDAHEPHDEQVQVWGEQVSEALLPWLKEFDGYDDKIAFFRTLEDAIEDITIAAHAAGMIRARRVSQ